MDESCSSSEEEDTVSREEAEAPAATGEEEAEAAGKTAEDTANVEACGDPNPLIKEVCSNLASEYCAAAADNGNGAKEEGGSNGDCKGVGGSDGAHRPRFTIQQYVRHRILNQAKENAEKENAVKENVAKEKVKQNVAKENVAKQKVKQTVAKQTVAKQNVAKENVAKQNVAKEKKVGENPISFLLALANMQTQGEDCRAETRRRKKRKMDLPSRVILAPPPASEESPPPPPPAVVEQVLRKPSSEDFNRVEEDELRTIEERTYELESEELRIKSRKIDLLMRHNDILRAKLLRCESQASRDEIIQCMQRLRRASEPVLHEFYTFSRMRMMM